MPSRRSLFTALLGGGLTLTGGPMADDLSELFLPPPAQPSQDWRYRQGVIKAWNPLTLENTIEVDGVDFTDLTVLGVADVATFAAGNVVGLAVIGDGGARTLTVIGRLVRPGTPEVISALSFLSSRTEIAFNGTTGLRSSSTYGDPQLSLPSGDVTAGPEVTVLVGASGRVIVTLGCWSDVTCGAGGVEVATMGVELTGANTVAAGGDAIRSLGGAGNAATSWKGKLSHTTVMEGLAAGETTFAAKYRSEFGATAYFADRTLMIQAL